MRHITGKKKGLGWVMNLQVTFFEMLQLFGIINDSKKLKIWPFRSANMSPKGHSKTSIL